MEHILVTGGAGYIGIHVVIELLNNAYNVIVIDNLSNSKIDFIDQIKTLTGKQIVFYECDILDKLDFIFEAHQINTVIHLAGVKEESEPLKYYQINVCGTINLLKTMDQYNCKNIIYSSTAYVYKPLDHPLQEDDPTESQNIYSSSKLIVEKILQDSGFTYKILRYFNVMGCHSSGKIFNNSLKTNTHLMATILNYLHGHIDKCLIEGDGTAMHDYIHVMDIASAHINIMLYPNSLIVNIGTGSGVTVNNIINHFNDFLSQPISICNIRRQDEGISYSCVDIKLAAEKMGWFAEYTIDDMCQHTLLWASN